MFIRKTRMRKTCKNGLRTRRDGEEARRREAEVKNGIA